jgi:hypothetical protein
MPKHSDGPPLGGTRFGGLEALRANLPSKAINPRGNVTEADARARKALADFAAYPERTKSIGKPLPPTQGTNSERAAARRKIEELKQQQRADYQDAILKAFGMNRELRKEALAQLQHFIELDQMRRYAVVHNGLKRVRILFYNKDEKAYWFVERNMFTGELKRSIDYGSREQAMIYHDADHILFCVN